MPGRLLMQIVRGPRKFRRETANSSVQRFHRGWLYWVMSAMRQIMALFFLAGGMNTGRTHRQKNKECLPQIHGTPGHVNADILQIEGSCSRFGSARQKCFAGFCMYSRLNFSDLRSSAKI